MVRHRGASATWAPAYCDIYPSGGGYPTSTTSKDGCQPEHAPKFLCVTIAIGQQSTDPIRGSCSGNNRSSAGPSTPASEGIKHRSSSPSGGVHQQPKLDRRVRPPTKNIANKRTVGKNPWKHQHITGITGNVPKSLQGHGPTHITLGGPCPNGTNNDSGFGLTIAFTIRDGTPRDQGYLLYSRPSAHSQRSPIGTAARESGSISAGPGRAGPEPRCS